MCIIVYTWEFLSVNELTAEKYLILGAAKLNHHIYFKGILTSKFEFKALLFGKEFLILFLQKEGTCGFLPG